MDRGSNESGRVWNILWQRESTLSPFTYQKIYHSVEKQQIRPSPKRPTHVTTIPHVSSLRCEDNQVVDTSIFLKTVYPLPDYLHSVMMRHVELW
ncbi:hypothetical protein T08_12556 [Trichinella sp. T8]|nr:hypothetical protein T08_12556 [Trichinella sp. T8]